MYSAYSPTSHTPASSSLMRGSFITCGVLMRAGLRAHIDLCPLKSTSYKLSLHLRRTREIRILCSFFSPSLTLVLSLGAHRLQIDRNFLRGTARTGTRAEIESRSSVVDGVGRFISRASYCNILIKIIYFVHEMSNGFSWLKISRIPWVLPCVIYQRSVSCRASRRHSYVVRIFMARGTLSDARTGIFIRFTSASRYFCCPAP